MPLFALYRIDILYAHLNAAIYVGDRRGPRHGIEILQIEFLYVLFSMCYIL